MRPDIEAYLNNELSEAERARFERDLAGNPDLRAEMEQFRPTWQVLRRAGMSRQVEGVLRRRVLRRRRRIAIWVCAGVLGIGGLVWWKMYKHELEAPPNNQLIEPWEKIKENPAPAPSRENPRDLSRQPIARGPDPISGPTAPVFRSMPAQEILPTAGIALADSFLSNYSPYAFMNMAVLNKYWEARDFNKYYSTLEGLIADKGATPSAELVRAACLLQLHRPASAMEALFPLRQGDRKVVDEADWLLALAFVMQGKDESARAALESIAENAGHPKREDAIRLLGQIIE